MSGVRDGLDWQIYFKKTGDGEDREEAAPFMWTLTKDPVTLRSAYPVLKRVMDELEDAEKTIDKPLSALSSIGKGGRKRLFSKAEEAAILEDFKKGVSKRFLAKKWGCSEKTVRNLVKRFEKE